MILFSHQRQRFSRTNNDRQDADRVHRFAVLSRIEFLHILLEHFYDSQRNANAGSARRLHRRQPVARSQDLLSPLEQFQRWVVVGGSVAHLVVKDSDRTVQLWGWPPPVRSTIG
jgi:hypothetical protein